MGLAFGCAALAPANLGLTQATDLGLDAADGQPLQIYGGVADLITRNMLGATSS